jgi:hypothetical protein
LEAREEPLLVLNRARILAGGAVGEALTASGGAARVTFVGNVRPLFRLRARRRSRAAKHACSASPSATPS